MPYRAPNWCIAKLAAPAPCLPASLEPNTNTAFAGSDVMFSGVFMGFELSLFPRQIVTSIKRLGSVFDALDVDVAIISNPDGEQDQQHGCGS